MGELVLDGRRFTVGRADAEGGGTTRLVVEAVRLARTVRGGGLGSTLMGWAHVHGRRHSATLAQLTSDRTRTEAHRFSERLGYASTHLGFKRDP